MSKTTFYQIIILVLTPLLFWSCEGDNDSENELLESQNYYSFTYNEKNYTIIKEAFTWLDAVAYAVESGGYLAEINSEEEQTAIFTALVSSAADLTFDETNNQFGFAAVWLGGNDLETEGVWVWNGNNDESTVQFWEGEINGNAVDGLYHNWGNEPDNNGDQDALCMGLEETPINTEGKWTDLDDSQNNLFFVIEYE